ncbi:MAG: hypothetical protein HYZ53_02185 [Planctomycetes bacterium]|nr:hypothetical protein [Planctomycetota bacterium]
MTDFPAQRFLLEVIAAIDRMGAPYMIMGGFAVRTWGIPRPTYDADIALSVDDVALHRLLLTLEEQGYDVPQEYLKGFLDRLAGTDKLKVSRFEGTTLWPVDLFLVRAPIFHSALARRRPSKIAGQPVWVMSPEDLILLKLIAFRRKDQLDVEEILKVVVDLELLYLRHWASRLGLTSRLDEFLSERPGR